MREAIESAAPVPGVQACKIGTRELTSSKASAAAHSARPVGWTTFGPQISDLFQFLVDFLPIQKSSKCRLLPKRPKNLKILASDRFLVRFWSFFGSLLAPFFVIFRDTLKTLILIQVSSETPVFASQTLPFWDQIAIIILCFVLSRFWTFFFRYFSNMMPKNMILGPSSGPS